MKIKTLVAALAVGFGSYAAVAQTQTGPVQIGFGGGGGFTAEDIFSTILEGFGGGGGRA